MPNIVQQSSAITYLGVQFSFATTHHPQPPPLPATTSHHCFVSVELLMAPISTNQSNCSYHSSWIAGRCGKSCSPNHHSHPIPPTHPTHHHTHHQPALFRISRAARISHPGLHATVETKCSFSRHCHPTPPIHPSPPPPTCLEFGTPIVILVMLCCGAGYFSVC